MNNKKAILATLGGTVVGVGIGGKEGFKKGICFGMKMGFLAGVAAGIVGTKLCMMGKDMVKEKMDLELQG